jgi:hypothetical protein
MATDAAAVLRQCFEQKLRTIFYMTSVTNMLKPLMKDIEYVIDNNDKVISVNDAWDAFALCNDAPGLLSECVIGRDWREFVQGDATRMYMEAILTATRCLGMRVSQSYRCDSPREKRYVQLTVELLADHHVLFHHHTTQVFEQKYVVNYVVPTLPVVAHKKVKRCSMCNRIELQGSWLETEQAVESGFLKAGAEVPVFYGICPDCHNKVKRIIAK